LDPLKGTIVVASAPAVDDGMSTGMSTRGAKRQCRIEQEVTRFAWWRQDLHAIKLLRAHIGEWTITRMLDYWWVMCFTGYRLNWNPWIWIPFPVDLDCTLLCAQVDKNKIQQYCIRQ
jgi:hypothetical protein